MSYFDMIWNALTTKRPRANRENQNPFGSMPAYIPPPETRSLQAQLNRNEFGMPASQVPAPSSLDYSYPASMYTYPGQGGYMDAGLPNPNMPAANASPAGPAPMPPQRPVSMPSQPSVPMPPVRPEGVGFNDPNRLVQGFNPYATGAGPNAQAFADQFAGGDLSKLAARTYRDEDGNSWNDYYVR